MSGTWMKSNFLHLRALHRRFNMFLVNRIYAGTNSKYFEKKRKLLIALGYEIGEGTKIVGPIECYGNLIIGRNGWIGKNLKINGNGNVIIGSNCDIAPEVTFQTGGHKIGNQNRRAGEGQIFSQSVGDGTWIGGRVTVLNNSNIGKACVIAGCSCVVGNVEDNSLVGGVPAKLIKKFEDD